MSCGGPRVEPENWLRVVGCDEPVVRVDVEARRHDFNCRCLWLDRNDANTAQLTDMRTQHVVRRRALHTPDRTDHVELGAQLHSVVRSLIDVNDIPDRTDQSRAFRQPRDHGSRFLPSLVDVRGAAQVCNVRELVWPGSCGNPDFRWRSRFVGSLVVRGFIHGNGPTDQFNLGSGGGAAYGGYGANSFAISAGAWFIAAALGGDRVGLTGANAFADVEYFDVTKDLLVLSNFAFGLGISGLTGSATQAVGTLLSTNTDGSFSSNSALLAYNVANGALFYRPNSSAGSYAVSVFENHASNVAPRLLIGV